MDRIYPAKLLLFGEYTVLLNSQALAVPLSQCAGRWVKHTRDNPLDPILIKYVDWLKDQDHIPRRTYNQIIHDFETGWRYEANIPRGYGLGSSGALVAAIYDRYGLSIEPEPNSVIRQLAAMENFFHGSSSGMDPMVSFTQQALYKDDLGQTVSLPDPGWPEGFHVYLVDSGSDRSTHSMVSGFRAKLKVNDHAERLRHELIPTVEHAIHFYLSGTGEMLAANLQLISAFQREHWYDMIPAPVQQLWDQCLNVPDHYMKFCGAGGGGYFLWITIGERKIDSTLPVIQIR